MRKRGSATITAYVAPETRKKLRKLVNVITDDVERDRVMGLGVMAGYAVQYLLTVAPSEALRIVLAGKAYEESGRPPDDPKPADGDSSGPLFTEGSKTVSGPKPVKRPLKRRTKRRPDGDQAGAEPHLNPLV